MDDRMIHSKHEAIDDVITQKVFKYKYRKFADHTAVFERRNNRVQERFFKRAL